MIETTLRYRLADGVSIRKEPFGAISYNQLTRQLVLITGQGVLSVIEAMNAGECLASAMRLVEGDEVRSGMIDALNGLLSRGVLREAS
ncbi:MAG: mycofactocin biosynthesis chaperone MftB [Acidimicrobiaceae bacterium]|nr:mycofactocin biosynthesis chaperone MftB [Acidimicrobiaceae bacterium]